MQSVEEELVMSRSVSNCFLHLTLQEYLAALYWSELGPEEVVRLVAESDLFPLRILVSEGAMPSVRYHWPALYFLGGLTKLQPIPLYLLKSSLTAGEALEFSTDDNKDDGTTHRVQSHALSYDFTTTVPKGTRECNPYFFQLQFVRRLLFRCQSNHTE